jgi:hypothetical protein
LFVLKKGMKPSDVSKVLVYDRAASRKALQALPERPLTSLPRSSATSKACRMPERTGESGGELVMVPVA